MATKKKKSSQLIKSATVKREMKESDLRVSKDSASELASHIGDRLKELGLECNKILVMQKRKTVDKDVLQYAAERMCPSLCKSWVTGPIGPTKLKLAAVIRTFRRGLGNDFRVSAEGKECVFGIADRLVKQATSVAQSVASVSKRKTIKVKDVMVAEGRMVPKAKPKPVSEKEAARRAAVKAKKRGG